MLYKRITVLLFFVFLLSVLAVPSAVSPRACAAMLIDGNFLWMGTYYDECNILSVDAAKRTASCRLRVATKLDYTIKQLPLDKVPKAALDEYQKSPRFAGARFISTVRAEYAAAIADSKTPAGIEKIKSSGALKTVREVETDIPTHQGKLLWLTGRLNVSSYYNYGYREAKETHYAFTLRDKTGTGYLYADRSESEQLRKTILAAPKGSTQMLCLVALVPGRTDAEASDIFAELLYTTPATP